MDKDELRQKFVKALSKMYEIEVPQYQNLKKIVQSVNQNYQSNQEQINQKNNCHQTFSDIDGHGAIRLAHPDELYFLKRLFACFNLFPVDYYDLTSSGIPVHSTAFRPIEIESILDNSFRIFTSLLRTDLINLSMQKKVKKTLKKRNIVLEKLLSIIEKIENHCSINPNQVNSLIEYSVDLFRFSKTALVSKKIYQSFHQTHPLIADIVSFPNPHINHLTLPTLDIDEVQNQMINQSIATKAIIEGAPRRKCPILLRQTAFLAVEEEVCFQSKGNQSKKGYHNARFGEIEQRGCALTKKGRDLYDQLFKEVYQQITPNSDGSNKKQYQEVLEKTFQAFPDDYNQLRLQKLAYFSYHQSKKKRDETTDFKTSCLEKLIELGLVDYQPIVYQDFLPISAAGIFRSNLGKEEKNNYRMMPNQTLFEKSLRGSLYSQFDCYQKIQSQSIEKIRQI